jgi:hypothetical protein
MEDDQETLDLGNLDVQIRGLRSGSTRFRTEVLRQILHNVESESGNDFATTLPRPS